MSMVSSEIITPRSSVIYACNASIRSGSRMKVQSPSGNYEPKLLNR